MLPSNYAVVDRSKILVVDDLKENLIALEGLLKRDDIEIFRAQSGTDALELMISHDFALALLDVHMPGMSGFELAELMRGTNKTKNVPIIFLTASASGQTFSFKGYEIGAVDFLLKPIDPHTVKSKVNIFIELHRQRKELKSLESKFRGLLETAPDAVVIIDEEGRIELANKQVENIFGYERSELIGKPVEMLIPNRFRRAHNIQRTEYAAHPTSRTMGRGANLFGLRKDGSEFSVDISLSPLVTEGGVLISAAVRDISERRALETKQEKLLADLTSTQAELKRAVQIRDDFMSIASHELKTPLTSLILQSQLRKRSLRKGDPSAFTPQLLTKMFDADEKQLARIKHLIEDMLDISRINSGKLSMNLERFDLCALVQEVVERNSDYFGAAGCPIKTDVCLSAVGEWDRFRIEQVIMNLLTNAVRYGGGKPISVGVRVASKIVQVSIGDEGRGIAKENHARIFEKFERAGQKGEISGLGLGLYIVMQILEAHFGSIRVESELGHGANFIVTLPLLAGNGGIPG